MSQWVNLYAGISSSSTFYRILQLTSSAVFSLSLRVLRQYDICGLPGMLRKASSAAGLSEGFPYGECVHSSKSKKTWVLD